MSTEEDKNKESTAESTGDNWFLNWMQQIYDAFIKLTRSSESDTIFMQAVKIVLKGIGILIFIALSPLMLLGLIIAFLAVF